jgi:DNA-binding transcriptional LysR family regulator
MKLDTLGVQAFVAIADHGTFQRAATSLHLSQTAMTRRIQNLEANLGAKLVERTTRSVALTGIGADFLPQARRLLSELSNALLEIRETGKAQRGDVCLACVPTAGIQFLPRIIQQYSALFPNNRISILDHASDAVTDAVLRREAEFGINVAQSHHPELSNTRLLTDDYVLICRSPACASQGRNLETAGTPSAHIRRAGQC